MTALIAEKNVANPFPVAPVEQVKPVSWLDFEKKHLPRADGFKYEWLDGWVSKSKKTIEKKQFYILYNLMNVLRRLHLISNNLGELVNEGDIFFLKHHRKPDIAYLSLEQLALTARDINQVPEFIIEVISKHDQINLVEEKMLDYARAGVKVAWQVFPLIETVKVYSGDFLSESRTLRNDQICSAAPVLPDFQISVQALFTKPPLPSETNN